KSENQRYFIAACLDCSCSIGKDSYNNKDMEHPSKNKDIATNDLFQESSKR
ncbi:hypothetical protein KI387_007406, partial [Taxus chinensis]